MTFLLVGQGIKSYRLAGMLFLTGNVPPRKLHPSERQGGRSEATSRLATRRRFLFTLVLQTPSGSLHGWSPEFALYQSSVVQTTHRKGTTHMKRLFIAHL